MLNYKIEPIISNGVATIGGNYIIPKGIGTVRLSWTDDEGQLHTNKLNNVLYFPDSPVNILSATALAEFIKDDEEKWIKKKEIIIFLLRILGSTKYNSSLKIFSTITRDSIRI